MKVDENPGSSLIKGFHDSTYLALHLNKSQATCGYTEAMHKKLMGSQKEFADTAKEFAKTQTTDKDTIREDTSLGDICYKYLIFINGSSSSAWRIRTAQWICTSYGSRHSELFDDFYK